MRTLFVCLIVLVSFVFTGCEDNSSGPAPHASTPDQPPADSENTVSFTGTVTYVPLEGGFFAINAEDGSRYDPLNLPAGFDVDGLRVRVYASIPGNVAGFHMYGTIIEIITISAL